MRVKRKLPKLKQRYAVVIDGETEFWYLQMLKRNERQVKVDIRPEIPQKKALSEQYTKVLELSEDYDKVYWVVDLDVILQESLLDKLLEYKRKIAKKYDKIVVLMNQPCLEYWFLIHFVNSAPHYANCDEAGHQLRKHLPDYDKSEKYFTKQDHDIYLKLKPRLKTAITNSESQQPFDKDNPNKGISELFILFNDIELN